MRRGQAAALIVLALLAGAAGFMAARQMTITEPAAAGPRPVPAFSLADLDGRMRDGSEWSGRIRLINFWATWCSPCVREVPLLIELQRKYGDSLQVIGIAVDDLEPVQDFASEAGINYPVLVGQQDALDVGNAFFEDFMGLPVTVVADADDRIVRVHVGELHREQAEAFLAELR